MRADKRWWGHKKKATECVKSNLIDRSTNGDALGTFKGQKSLTMTLEKFRIFKTSCNSLFEVNFSEFNLIEMKNFFPQKITQLQGKEKHSSDHKFKGKRGRNF